ncbi:tyrosine-type recombinase/integrase [Candidatus Harpocratesius sp.]
MIRKRKGRRFPKTPEVYLCKSDKKLIEKYIESRNSDSIKRHHLQHLNYFNNFIMQNYPGVKSIFEVSPEQFRDFFIHLEKKTNPSLKIRTKLKYRTSLKSFFNYVLTPKIARNEAIKYNYSIIFSNSYFQFTDIQNKMPENKMSKQDVLKILKFFFARNFRDYIAFAILAFTGMRPIGLLNIKVQNIDLKNRMIKTIGKRTKTNRTGEVRYFFPEFFRNDLEAFILERQESEDLFNITSQNLRRQLKKYPYNDYHLHQFRETLNVERLKMGLIDPDLRKMLLNQHVSDVNVKHYVDSLKDPEYPEDLRELYDKFFPYPEARFIK